MPCRRVVHVVNSLERGGGERIVCDLVERTDTRAYDPHVLCLFGGGAWAPRVARAGVSVHVLGLPPGLTLRGWRRVGAMLRSLEPAIVHTHLAEAAWYGISAAAALSVPARVLHLQNCYRHWGPKLLALNRVSTAPAGAVIACSDAVRAFAIARLGYPPERVRTIHNGAELARFGTASGEGVRERLGISPHDLVLITVASLTPQKGHEVLLEALAGLGPSIPSVLLLVGNGVLRPHLEGRARALGIAERVRFLGRRDDVPQLLAAADVFVLASHWEGLPLAAVEAGAAGLPVVASAVDGLPEVVMSGVTGTLVPPGEPRRLGEALAELLESQDKRRTMGARAHQHVAAHFDVAVTADRVAEVYEGLLLRARPGR